MLEGADKAAYQARQRDLQRRELERRAAELRRGYWERKAHKYAGL